MRVKTTKGAIQTRAVPLRAARVSVRPCVSRKTLVCRSTATDEIVEKLKGITLLEASELVKQIEETFGVDASAAAGGGDAAEEVEEQTEFDVIISEIDSAKKIAAIKVVRQLTTLGLKEAKDAVTELPN